MKAAKARGVRSGPKPKLSREQVEYAKRLILEGQRHEATAALFNVSRVTLYRALLKAS
jgi:DNA invertase Pin-like site-specific DNA recombinase